MKQYVTSPHAVLLYIAALIVVGYNAAYPYLNPQNLQWENAIIYSCTAIVSAVVLGHGIVGIHARLERVEALSLNRGDNGDTPTRRVPIV